MESERLPAQFGLTAKQATVPVFFVGSMGWEGWRAYMYVCVGMCPEVQYADVFVVLHNRKCELLCIHHQSPHDCVCVHMCVCRHDYAAAMLIPECCSLPEVRPWEASSLMSLLLNQVASQTYCTKSVSLWLWYKSCWCKSQGLGVVANLMSQPAGSQTAFHRSLGGSKARRAVCHTDCETFWGKLLFVVLDQMQ